jgi:hypothetical protein
VVSSLQLRSRWKRAAGRFAEQRLHTDWSPTPS